jgi:hypothetical protein
MAQRITAMVAYRHPAKHAFWDETCIDRVGAMRIGAPGKLQIKRYDEWLEVDEAFILYADPSNKKLWTRYY